MGAICRRSNSERKKARHAACTALELSWELEIVPRIWPSPHSALGTASLLVYTGTTAGVCPIYTSVRAERADGVMIQALEGQLKWPFGYSSHLAPALL